jgi:hypothetical protein
MWYAPLQAATPAGVDHGAAPGDFAVWLGKSYFFNPESAGAASPVPVYARKSSAACDTTAPRHPGAFAGASFDDFGRSAALGHALKCGDEIALLDAECRDRNVRSDRFA